MSELPKGWRLVKVREAGTVQLGRQRSPDVHRGANMRPYLRVANVFEDRIDLGDVMEMHFEPREVERFVLKKGDILLNEGQSRELVGRPAMYRDELPGACFTNSLVRFQASESVDSRFALELFRHWLKSGAFQRIAQITTNIAHLGAGRFAEMDFPLPPLEEQRRIAAKLRALQARSRRAREALDAVPPLLEKLRQSILAAAFRGEFTADWRAKNKNVEPASKLLERIRTERRKKWEESELAKQKAKGKAPTDEKWKSKYKEPAAVDTTGLPELPEGWCWSRFEELCLDLRGGVTSRARQEATPFKVLRSSSVRHGTIDFDDVSFVEEDASDDFQLKKDDILFTRLSGTLEYVANAAVVGDLGGVRIQYPDRIFRARSSTLVDRQFIASAFGCQHLRAPLEEAAKSTAGHQRISMSDLADLPLPLPSQDEQSVIAGLVRAGLAVVARHRCAAEEIRGRLGLLERSVLATAFRGELVPQAPTDNLAGAASRTNGGIGGGLTPAARSRASSPSRSPRAQIDGDT